MASSESSEGLELDDTPPSDGLASYDLFVKWVLSSPTATVDEAAPSYKYSNQLNYNTLLKQWSSDFDSLDTTPETFSPEAPTFASVTQAKLARATVESEHEALADELFAFEHECEALDDAIRDLEAEKAQDKGSFLLCPPCIQPSS